MKFTEIFEKIPKALLQAGQHWSCFSPGYFGNNLVWQVALMASIKSTTSKHKVLSEGDIVTSRSRYLFNEGNFYGFLPQIIFVYPIIHWIPHCCHPSASPVITINIKSYCYTYCGNLLYHWLSKISNTRSQHQTLPYRKKLCRIKIYQSTS